MPHVEVEERLAALEQQVARQHQLMDVALSQLIAVADLTKELVALALASGVDASALREACVAAGRAATAAEEGSTGATGDVRH